MSENIRYSGKLKREQAKDEARAQQQRDKKAFAYYRRGHGELYLLSPEDPAAFDDIGLSQRAIPFEQLSKEDQERERAEFGDLCRQFGQELQSRGYILSRFGGEKLEHWLNSQHFQNREVKTLDAVRRSFERLLSLGCFSEHELDASNVQPEVVPETESECSLDAIDKLPDTREGDRKAREIANAHYWTTEAKAMFNGWKEHLYRDYNFIPTEEESRRIVDFFMHNNLSFLRHENWNRARRWAVRTGLFRPDMVTADEILASTIEHTGLANLSHDEASRLKQSIRTIHGQPFRD